jgi:hypothetical protein
MKKLGLAFGAMFLLLLLFLPLLVALTTARTGMIQAQANAAQATANTVQATTTLVGQCLTGLMVFIALLGGMVLGVGLHTWHSTHALPWATPRPWLPVPPEARRRSNRRLPYSQGKRWLSPLTSNVFGYTQPSAPPTHPLPIITMADLEVDPNVDEDFPGSPWGF